jgi:endo-1,4-beta-xylanase
MRYIGTALKAEALKEFEYKNITLTNFNSITPENEMKWSTIEKTRGRYKWKESDQLVAMAQQYSQKIRGHTLVWHRQMGRGHLTDSHLTDSHLTDKPLDRHAT